MGGEREREHTERERETETKRQRQSANILRETAHTLTESERARESTH